MQWQGWNFSYRYTNTKICDGTIIDGNGCMQILSGHLKLIVALILYGIYLYIPASKLYVRKTEYQNHYKYLTFYDNILTNDTRYSIEKLFNEKYQIKKCCSMTQNENF